jgi:hypothetical protein
MDIKQILVAILCLEAFGSFVAWLTVYTEGIAYDE